MAPPRNLRRRDALADAAIEILGTAGSHKLSHRAVDEGADLPPGTASNYFPSRDDLLAAVANRIAELHLADMAAANREVAAPAGLDSIAELIGGFMYECATRYRTRYLAIFELTLEANRRPWLAQSVSELASGALSATMAQHRALGLSTSPQRVQAMITLFAGSLLFLVAGPPEAVTRENTRTLARSLVTGVLGLDRTQNGV